MTVSELHGVDAVLSNGGLVHLRSLGPRALAAHPAEEIRIVVAPAAKRFDGRHHLGGAVGIMFVEPGAEQRRDLVRQAHRKIETAGRSRGDRRFDDMLELVIGDGWNDRRDRTAP